jgi:MYXO-CTERM domain-containing protein
MRAGELSMRQRPFTIALIVAALSWVGAASSVQAHIKLTKPESWLKENDIGAPQKGGPCGPGGGDDIKPSPLSEAVTTFEVGETITLEWTETVPHPGHFRVAFAEDRNDLKDPELELDGSCNYDESKLPTGAHGNVLADGVFPRSRTGPRDATGKTFSTQITLPAEPCEKCTLQLIQFMENHPPSCIYYHCADVRLVAKGSAARPAPGAAGVGAAGVGAAGAAIGGSGAAGKTAGTGAAVGGSSAATSGSSAAGKTAGGNAAVGGSQAGAAAASGSPAADDGGCSVRPVRSAHGQWALILVTALGLLAARRRRQTGV